MYMKDDRPNTGSIHTFMQEVKKIVKLGHKAMEKNFVELSGL